MARPLVYEPPAPVTPRIITDHEILNGVEGGVPPISGLVLSTVKENPLVEIVLQSPLPANEKNATVLATWTYGAGKAAAFTTDAGRRWAARWREWEGYDKFFSQLVRWAMRPAGDTGKFNVATNVRDGRTQVVVTAIDADEQFLNDQAMTAAAIAPDMSTVDMRMEQTAPGRYLGEFPSTEAGSYLIVVNPGGGAAPIRTGVNVGYSAEYRDHETNLPLLASLAKLHAGDGPAGVLVEGGLDAKPSADKPSVSPFRRDLSPVSSNQSIWPWVVAAASCVFWGDVFVRRVQVDLSWLPPLLGRMRDVVLRRRRTVETPAMMSRLRSRKAEISDQIASQRAAARFEADDRVASPGAEAPPVISAGGNAPVPKRPAAVSSPVETKQPPSYTERLLQAKKDAQRRPPGGG